MMRQLSPPVWFQIREQDPLKQGLKLCFVIPNISEKLIREQDPLKQGLKLTLCDDSGSLTVNS